MASKRPKIKLTIVGRLGHKGCHRGHRIGNTFDFDTERGKICPMLMHVAFPYIDILRYGGKVPGQPDGTAIFCCSDPETANVVKAEIVYDEADNESCAGNPNEKSDS